MRLQWANSLNGGFSSTTERRYSGTKIQEEPKWLPVDPKFATTAIHAGFSPKDDKHGFVVPSITVASIAEQDAMGVNKGYDYTRYGNPTRTALQKNLAALENGKYAFVFSSGHAAISNTFSLLESGDSVILADSIYAGTRALFTKYASKFGIQSEFIDMYTDTSMLEKTLKPNTKLVWLETPSNPTLNVIDIAQTVECVRKCSKDIIVLLDNTFLTPYYQRPLNFGVDLVLHSLSKHGGGHSDILMGALVTSRDDLKEKLTYIQKDIGAVPSPFVCYLAHRSLKTLHIRMPLHMSNALGLARFLESHPKVEKVLHPGLPSHPQHALALKQASGHCGLFSFYIKDKSCGEFLRRIKIVKFAPSLGGADSVASVPYFMSDGITPPELKQKFGITENMVRISVGLESLEDIIQDVDQALNY